MIRNSGKALTALTGTCVSLLALAWGCSSLEEEGGTLQQAVHLDGTFELDGNAVDEAAPGDDWDTVLLEGGGDSTANTGVIADPMPLSVFTTGGSKDINDVPEWQWKDGNVPPKDDLTNAYAASYNVDGDLVIYFGADRFAQNGDAQMGFWFFQNAVALNADGTFSGEHEVGDILVITDFTNGGKIGTVKVYEWVGDGSGSHGNINLIASAEVLGGQADILCNAEDTVCGVVNTESTPAPWPYTPKFGDPGTFPPGAFFEGGINISELLGREICVASFLAESRASQEEHAVLKDFVLGSLDTCKPPPPPCKIKVKKECEVKRMVDKDTFSASFKATISNACCCESEKCSKEEMEDCCVIPKGTEFTVVDNAGTADPSDDVTVMATLDHDLGPGDPPLVVTGYFKTKENPPKENVVKVRAEVDGQIVEGESEPTECKPLDEKK